MIGMWGRPAVMAWLPAAVCLLAAVGACSHRPSAPVGAAPESSPALAPSATSPAAPEAPAAAPALPELPPYEVRIGREVYQHYCQTCHGDSGAGDGFNAFNLDPHPRDLSDPDFQKKKTDDDLRDAIRRGGAGVGLSSLMPPWGHTLSDRQIDGLILYMRSFRRPPG
jgi:mono/diheme cytochrome c family protein